MPKRSDGLETRQKILEAAAKLFAASGFKQTRNLEISKYCKVNSALISYYFGDKENIYREAWKHSCEETAKKYPLTFSEDQYGTLEEKLYLIVKSAVHRYMDETCYDNGIFQQEVASKTGLIDDVHEKTILALREALIDVVSAILDQPKDSSDVRLSVLSIVSMCIVSIKKIQNMEELTTPYDYCVDSRVQNVFKFAIGGLKNI